MRKKTKYRKVPYTVFVAKDGKEFEDENKCRLHEKIIAGKAKICPECHGEGYKLVTVMGEDYHTGAPMEYTEHEYCNMCKGKGYLEKTEVWQ